MMSLFRRSPAEIAFRLRQEWRNFIYFLRPPSPSLDSIPMPLARFPDPERVATALRGSAYAAAVEKLADELLEHRFPLLGQTVESGQRIAWRRDWIHGQELPADYFRRLPYLDFARAGDHKVIWEPSRHQHLVLLAQAWRLTGRAAYRDEIRAQMLSWWEQNPFQRGIHWASALEVAFRALSWLWVHHLAGESMDPEWRALFQTSLYQHGLHLEANLSIYFSPNTHLLGEAIALHALGVLCPAWPRAVVWRELGGRWVQSCLADQVRADGSHNEQSTYYHLYATDFFLFHRLLIAPNPEYDRRLEAMVDYLAAAAGPECHLPPLGDDDGGRFFHPYGSRPHFCRATLATAALMLVEDRWPWNMADVPEQAAWWLDTAVASSPHPHPPAAFSRWFPDAGLAAIAAGPVHLLIDAGPFGTGSAGHSHADTLSLVLRVAGEDWLIDPGTFTYVADPDWRNRFRGTAMHNTVLANPTGQALPRGPFGWTSPPAITVHALQTASGSFLLDASCHVLLPGQDYTHRRVVLFLEPGLLAVIDRVAGATAWEAHWIGPAAPSVQISGGVVEPLAEGWRAIAHGRKEPVPMVRAIPALAGEVLVSWWDCTGAGWRHGGGLEWLGPRSVKIDLHPSGATVSVSGVR